jgi:glycosyltransferase involved in cell wall biosynthesis
MRVLALIEGPNHVCYRYRIAAFAGELARRGGTLESLPLDPNTLGRNAQIREAEAADVVILQRKLLPLWQLRLLRRTARVLVYDFDDALFGRDSYAPKGSESWARLAHFWATVYTADAVIAGNEYLRRQAAAYSHPDRVHLIPTCVDTSLYPMAEHRNVGGDTKLVWIGQHSTLPCLDRAQAQLARVAARLPGIQLRVICNQFPTLDGVSVEACPWSATSEAADIAAADVGISWLPDDDWSQGKCGLKVLQYMAAGLPVVANPVGMNREMIVDGETGFLASTLDEWADAVERLANDPRLRRAMGEAARLRVEADFGVERWAGEFVSLVESVRDAARRAPPSTSNEPFTGDVEATSTRLD